jgi:enoyl-CoA hydratase
MGQKEYTKILYEKRDRVAIISLNRPEALNALSIALLKEMHDAFQDAAEDGHISVIVLTGAGGKVFCAGADVTEVTKLSTIGARDYSLSIYEVTRFMENIRKPIVAKINGFCLGGGHEIAMSCDFRIASDKAKFAQPEVNLGIIPGAGGTQRLTRLIGKVKSFEMNMLGDQIDANEAYRLGLLNKVVPVEELDKAVDEFVTKLLSKSAVTLGIIKSAINKGLEMDLDRALCYEAECFADALSTEDAKEGTKAFLEKRKPEFKNK